MRLLDTAFPAIGPIGPTTDQVDEPFWTGLGAGELRVQRCGACGHWIWAPQWRCGECVSYDLRWQAVAPEGRIYSWIRTWHAFSPLLAEHVPYVTALVELPGAGGVRMLGILHADRSHRVRIGDRVTGALQRPSDATSGWPVLRWLPAETEL